MLPMLKTVITSVFKKSSTVLYPLEKKEQPAGMRGHVVNHIDECIYCGICQKKCPTGAIDVKRAELMWSIAFFDCVQCGHCVRVCPKKCLEMRPEKPEAFTKKATFIVHGQPKAK